jgi:hypothetical protein
MIIICVKGSCFETPLYDHVPGNKQDGDKDKGMRKGEELKGGGGDRRREGLKE